MVDLRHAVRLLDTDVVACPIERDLLVVSGTDAASYLQGQLSQDVEHLAVGATARSLLLQPQGKVDTWLRVNRRAGGVYWLDTDRGHGPAARERLNRFRLRVDAAIEAETVTGLAVRGAGAGAARAAAEAVLAAPRFDGVVTLDGGWGGIDGFDVLGPPGVADPGSLAEALAIPIGPGGTAEVVRVLQGLPAMGSELDGSTIPAAAGIVASSVDFTKGCFVGQELVARIDSRGNNTPTRLHRLRFAGEIAPPVGAELVLDGEVVGSVTSAVAVPGRDAVGLGYLKRSVATPAMLAVRPGPQGPQGETSAEALPLPAPAS